MIGYLEGQVLEVNIKSALFKVGNLGYEVFMTEQSLASLTTTSSVSMWTHLVVKEDALDLYGFFNKEELTYFKLLITISGIGPKSALSILSLAPPDVLKQAVLGENTSYLTKVSGIGKKSAERIIIELRDKLGDLSSGDDFVSKSDNDIVDALVALGYNLNDIRKTLQNIPSEMENIDDRIRFAIKYIGNHNK